MTDKLKPWYELSEPCFGHEAFDRDNRAMISQTISLKRIADSLEIIAAKPLMPPQDLHDLQHTIYNAISEAGFAIARRIS